VISITVISSQYDNLQLMHCFVSIEIVKYIFTDEIAKIKGSEM